MRDVRANISRGGSSGSNILPFNPEVMRSSGDESELRATSLAALIAVTILHDSRVSAEDKLMEIIERSGEIEILDADEAYADLGLEGLEEVETETGRSRVLPANDNEAFEVIE